MRACALSAGRPLISNCEKFSPAQVSGGLFNTLEYRETERGRAFKARLTDTAIESVGESLGTYMGRVRGVHQGIGTARRGEARSTEESVIDAGVAESAPDHIETYPGEGNAAQVPHLLGDDMHKLEHFVQRQGDRWVLVNSRLKATNKLDHAKRAIVLLLYAHEVHGEPHLARGSITTFLKEIAANNGAIRHWLANDAILLLRGEANTVFLSLPGKDQAREILDEALDPQRPDTYTPGQEIRRRKSRGIAGSSADIDKQGQAGKMPGRPKKVAPLLPSWDAKARELQLDGNAMHRLLAERTLADKGVVALWAIRVASGDAVKDVSARTLADFLWEAFQVRESPRSLDNALREGAGKVENVQGSIYHILPPGSDYAETLVNTIKAKPEGRTRPKSA